MALAIHFDDLLRQGLARDQSDLARLGQVTPARMSQIMSLLNLSPKIQEAILFLPAVTKGRSDLILADLLPIAREWDWSRQGERWGQLVLEEKFKTMECTQTSNHNEMVLVPKTKSFPGVTSSF
ncbi:MAG: hypothetical protein U0798_17540 [Gemmataceae bacterium]